MYVNDNNTFPIHQFSSVFKQMRVHTRVLYEFKLNESRKKRKTKTNEKREILDKYTKLLRTKKSIEENKLIHILRMSARMGYGRYFMYEYDGYGLTTCYSLILFIRMWVLGMSCWWTVRIIFGSHVKNCLFDYYSNELEFIMNHHIQIYNQMPSISFILSLGRSFLFFFSVLFFALQSFIRFSGAQHGRNVIRQSHKLWINEGKWTKTDKRT